MEGVSAETDIYRGVHLRLHGEVKAEEFEQYVRGVAVQEGLSSVWVYLTTAHLPILDLLTNRLDFSIHHGLGKEVVVYKWLSKV